MYDHLYSYDKIYKYEIVVEPIPDSSKYRGFVYLNSSRLVLKSEPYREPEMLRKELINDVNNYLDSFGAIPLTNTVSVIE